MVQFRNNSSYPVTLFVGYQGGSFGSVFVAAGQTWEKSFAGKEPLSIQWWTSPATLSLNPGVNQTVTVAAGLSPQVED